MTYTASFSSAPPSGYSSKLLFRQLFEKESSTYTYLLADVAHPDKPALVSLLFVAGKIVVNLYSNTKTLNS